MGITLGRHADRFNWAARLVEEDANDIMRLDNMPLGTEGVFWRSFILATGVGPWLLLYRVWQGNSGLSESHASTAGL